MKLLADPVPCSVGSSGCEYTRFLMSMLRVVESFLQMQWTCEMFEDDYAFCTTKRLSTVEQQGCVPGVGILAINVNPTEHVFLECITFGCGL